MVAAYIQVLSIDRHYYEIIIRLMSVCLYLKRLESGWCCIKALNKCATVFIIMISRAGRTKGHRHARLTKGRNSKTIAFLSRHQINAHKSFKLRQCCGHHAGLVELYKPMLKGIKSDRRKPLTGKDGKAFSRSMWQVGFSSWSVLLSNLISAAIVKMLVTQNTMIMCK